MALTETKLAEAPRRDADPAAGLPATASRRAVDRAVLVQFVQFCVVGAVSTALNVVFLNLFMARGLGVIWSHIFAFTGAVTNGFFLNRAWTFRDSRVGTMERQYVMFVLVNIVGLGLSLLIVLGWGAWMLHSGSGPSLARLYHTLTGRDPVMKQLAYSLGELVATPPCAVWNFAANKLWTFGGSGDQA